MSRRLLRWSTPAVLLLLLGAATPAEPAHFSMILTRDGRTWRATCETGCNWNAVSARKAWFQSERVQVDNIGIYTGATALDPTATFAFLISTDGPNGWKARSLRGTGWTEIGFTCGTEGPCRARLTETSVEGIE